MASKRADAIRREKVDENQVEFNARMESLLLAIAEKVGVNLEKSEKAGQGPGPAELAEVMETPQEEEELTKPSEENEDLDEEEGLGW